MNKLAAIFKLTRIEHSIMLVMAVIAAELITKGLPSPTVFILSLVVPVFISMAAFAINDYFDMEVDRLNKKDRPLVNGSLAPRTALYVTGICLVIGIGAGSVINRNAFGITLLFGILALLYSYKLKESLLLGNAYIALSMSIPFIFGDYVVSSSLGVNILMVAIMIFMSGLAREIHGTIRDYHGDTKGRNARTLPRSIGMENASIVAFVLYLLAILVSVYLFLGIAPFKSNLFYAVPVFASDLMLFYVAIGYLYKKDRKFYSLSRNISLLAMGIALIAFLLAPPHLLP